MPNFFEEVKAAVIDDAALSQGDTSGAGRSVSRERRRGGSWVPSTVGAIQLEPSVGHPWSPPKPIPLLPTPHGP